jgi:flagellar FliL protein
MRGNEMAKAPPKADTKANPPEGKSKKKMILLVAIALLIFGIAGGAFAWYTSGHKADGNKSHKEVNAEPSKPPVFVNLDPFTVNLQPEKGEQYLQITLTLQVTDQAQVDLIKLNMPQVRSRLLTLLSSKMASEISTVEGKKLLTDEILTQIKQPFAPNSSDQTVTSVFFTSFIIQ